jgi:hypothetical protein
MVFLFIGSGVAYSGCDKNSERIEIYASGAVDSEPWFVEFPDA